MIIWGMVGNSHDASIAVFKDMKLQKLYTSQDRVHSDELVAKACHTNMSGPDLVVWYENCLLYTSPSPRDRTRSRMPSSA